MFVAVACCLVYLPESSSVICQSAHLLVSLSVVLVGCLFLLLPVAFAYLPECSSVTVVSLLVVCLFVCLLVCLSLLC